MTPEGRELDRVGSSQFSQMRNALCSTLRATSPLQAVLTVLISRPLPSYRTKLAT